MGIQPLVSDKIQCNSADEFLVRGMSQRECTMTGRCYRWWCSASPRSGWTCWQTTWAIWTWQRPQTRARSMSFASAPWDGCGGLTGSCRRFCACERCSSTALAYTMLVQCAAIPLVCTRACTTDIGSWRRTSSDLEQWYRCWSEVLRVFNCSAALQCLLPSARCNCMDCLLQLTAAGSSCGVKVFNVL